MDEAPMNDVERLFFFEKARETAEDIYKTNPLDAENLTRWGAALLELASFSEPSHSIKFVTDAESKLEEALQINPRKHTTLWSLGNAYTSHALQIQDHEISKGCFAKATQCFEEAVKEDPTNSLYTKSLELSNQMPVMYSEFHMKAAPQMVSDKDKRTSASSVKVSKNMKKSVDKYEILGWVILAVGIIAWVGMAKSHVHSPPR